MKLMPYADPKIVENYPGIRLSEEDKQRVADSTVTVTELATRPELVLYAVGQALSGIITSIFSVVEELTDEETALRGARELGLRFGEANYSRFMKNRGLKGGPEAFCQFQDYNHSLRGPRHATALFALYDDKSVLVRRTDCLFFPGIRGEPNKYVRVLEEGFIEGYKRADPSFSGVENPRCLCKGSTDGCEQRFIFKT